MENYLSTDDSSVTSFDRETTLIMEELRSIMLRKRAFEKEKIEKLSETREEIEDNNSSEDNEQYNINYSREESIENPNNDATDTDSVKIVDNNIEFIKTDTNIRRLREELENPFLTRDGKLSKPPDDDLIEKSDDEETPAQGFMESQSSGNLGAIHNTKALTKNAMTYELEKFEKNAMIIFNQEKVEGYPRPRYGTKKDAEALTNTFQSFGFEVVEHFDLSRDEIFAELKKFSETDFTDYGCVAVTVLTHGSTKGALRASDEHRYYETDLINYFKTHSKPTLVTKPKLFIIQACRGSRLTPASMVGQARNVRKDFDEVSEPYTLPVESDMLVLHSTYAGNPSHRDELHGSWFIQSLCKKINQLATTHDFESIVTEVKREVAIDRWHEEYNRRTYEFDINKQMPVVTSTLIRKLYLKKYGDPQTIRNKDLMTSLDGNESYDGSTAASQDTFYPCACFLDRFEYLKTCVRHFVEEYPDDETAISFLNVAEAFDDREHFNTAKERLSRAMQNHLMSNARDCSFYKYLYFYKD